MLQIKIQRIYSGLTDIFKTSSGEWEKYILDLRQNTEQITGLEDEAFSALILSEIGYYLGVFKKIKGRSGDLVAAWLFIPNDLVFSGEDIERRIKEIRGIISNTEIDKAEEESLMKICQSTSAKKTKDFVSPMTVDRTSRKYAFRRYGKGVKYSLSEILDRLDQDYYAKYSAILLIESDDWEADTISNWEDITNSPLINKLHYRLPEVPENYNLIFDNDKFTSKDSATVKVAENIFTKDLTIKREGYEDIQIPQFYLGDLASLDLQKQEWNKVISPSLFAINSSDADENMQINSRITIEDVEKSGDRWIIPEKDYKEKQFTITVEADGYDTYSLKINLSQFSPVKIELKKKEKEHRFHIRPTDHPVTFSLTGRRKFKASPIKGYKIERRPDEDKDSVSYTLIYKPFAFMGSVASKIFLLIAIVALLGLGYYLGNAFPASELSGSESTSSLTNTPQKTNTHLTDNKTTTK